MKKIVVLTGAGISAESGLSTFRDNDGLWNNYRVEEVATPEAWESDMQLVLDFYNQRRKQLLEARPNEAHKALVRLEEGYEVIIVTQNVDDLHERAGSSHIIHLHGELRKARSTAYPELIYGLEGWELKAGDLCERGSQLRPHVVWFGEPVPLIPDAMVHCSSADIFLVVGTSLKVYPAAGLIHSVPSSRKKYIINPDTSRSDHIENLEVIAEKAGTGVPRLVADLLARV